MFVFILSLSWLTSWVDVAYIFIRTHWPTLTSASLKELICSSTLIWEFNRALNFSVTIWKFQLSVFNSHV